MTVSAFPEVAGTVHGGGWYAEGATATLQATPANGYVFTGFTGDVNSAPVAVTLPVPGPLNLVARFSWGGEPGRSGEKKEWRSEGATGWPSHSGQADWRMNAAAVEGEER